MDKATLAMLVVEVGALALVYMLWRASRRSPEEVRAAEDAARRESAEAGTTPPPSDRA